MTDDEVDASFLDGKRKNTGSSRKGKALKNMEYNRIENQPVRKAKNSSKLPIILCTIAIVIAVVAAVAVVAKIVLTPKLNDQKTTEEVKEEVKEKKSVISAENAHEVLEEWVQEDTDRYVPQYYTVVQNTEWNFPDGSSPSTNAVVENDTDNETPVYFDVVDEATGETIYSSPVLELGAKVEKFQLDKVLEAGVYDCTVIYHLVDEEQNDLTTVNVGVTITVEN